MLMLDLQGSKAYVKAIQKVGLVTEDECKLILSGLEKVSYTFLYTFFFHLNTFLEISQTRKIMYTDNVYEHGTILINLTGN